MSAWIDESVAAPRLYAVLLGGFAFQALLIASAGLYGLLSHTATLRRREMGIRLAIGARPLQVTSLFLRRGLAVVLAGGVIGTLGGVTLARLLRTQLYEVQPADPVTIAGVGVMFLAVAIGAMLAPSLGAGRIDPARVLHSE